MGKIERLRSAETIAPRSRQELAVAIEDVARLKVELSAAEDAALRAKRNQYAADEKLEALLAKPEPQDLGQRFISASAAGESIGVRELAGPAREDVAKEIEREIATWAKVRAACEAAAKDARESLRHAETRREGCVDEVLRGSGSAICGEIIEGVENLQTALIERRVLLRFFERKGLIDDDELAKRVRNLLSSHFFPMAGGLGEWGNFDAHHRHQQWSAAREALKADPDAILPGDAA